MTQPNEVVVDVETAVDRTRVDVDEVEEYTPPTADEWKAQQAKLKKANDEAKNHRLRAEELASKGESEAEQVARKAREDATNETNAKWKTRFIKSEAKRALNEAGVLISVDKALNLLTLDDVEVDDDGQVVGLTEAVRAAKKANSEFFGTRNSAQVNGGDRDSTARTQPKTAAEQIAARLMGSGR